MARGTARRGRAGPVAPDRHRLRLIQQVPASQAGQPGVYGPDAIMGRYWATRTRGVDFISVENQPTLMDASEFVLTLPPVSSDGVEAGDRYYFLTDTPDPSGSGRVAYFPGDEWFEVIRGTNDLVASATPYDVLAQPQQVQATCRDALHLLKKTRETSAGLWCQAPRDVWEHYCNTPEAPIWMADLSFKPLGEVVEGDEVVGWESNDVPASGLGGWGTGHIGNRLAKARVLAVARRRAPIVKITLASGRTVRCTPDHQWVIRSRRQRYRYGVPQVGDHIAHVIDETPPVRAELEHDAGWLGGMYDGEGSHRFISQYVNVNPVAHARIGEVARRLGLDLRPTPRGYYIGGGRQGFLDFLAITRPVKRERLIQELIGVRRQREQSFWGAYRFTKPDRVVSIEPDGEGEVLSMQTTTGNYVAWGYASRNCRLWLPVLSEDFPNAATEFPAAPSATPQTTPDGLWHYIQVAGSAGASYAVLGNVQSATTAASLTSATTWSDAGFGDHSCWRAEARVTTTRQRLGQVLSFAVGDASGQLGLPGNQAPYAQIAIIPTQAGGQDVQCSTAAAPGLGTHQYVDVIWPSNVTGLADPSGQIPAPLTFVIEARDRWMYFYVNGQLVSIGERPRLTAPLQLNASLSLFASFWTGLPPYAWVDYVVVRKTSPPLNGGISGDYQLPSPPAVGGGQSPEAFKGTVTPAPAISSGGLTGEYFDAASVSLPPNVPIPAIPSALPPLGQIFLINYGGGGKTSERIDALGGSLPANAVPDWQASAAGAFAVRWTGSIYLDLANHDIRIGLPAGYLANSDVMRIFVGRTRAREDVVSSWGGLADVVYATGTLGSNVLTGVDGWLPDYTGLLVGQGIDAYLPNPFSTRLSLNGVAATGTQSATITGLDPAARTITMSSPVTSLNGPTSATLFFVTSGSVSMRQWLGAISGWYPIVIEYYWAPTGGIIGGWQGNANPNWTWSVDGGPWVPPPSSALAPLGVHRSQIQAGDSHYDTLRSLVDEIGYQFKVEPRRLESGAFPGAIIPRARVGRDTDMVLTDDEAVNPQIEVKSEDVADALLAAAQGLGGNSAGSMTLEAFDFARLLAHPIVSQEFENIPSTTVEAEFVMHLLSLLGYRSAAFEDLQASQIGQREKRDTFPLTGQLAEFDWQPGDGVRVQIPSLFVDDDTPRQIFALKRMLYPDGMGENQASFRPRVRTPMETLRRFVRQVYGARRAFQGQIVESVGSRAVGGAYTEAVLPQDLSLVRQASLVVLSKTAWFGSVQLPDTTTPYAIEVNGQTTTLPFVYQPGVYDLGAYVARNNTYEPRMVARLVTFTPGCQVSYQLRLRTLVPAL